MGPGLGRTLGDLTGEGNSKEETSMKWFINSMLGFWILLLAVSLGAAAIVYEVWLKGQV
jgi:hypothetical protein